MPPFNYYPFAIITVFQGGLYFVAVKQLTTRDLSTHMVVGMSIIMHLVYLGSISILSNDVYRYHWDALIFLNGYNPLSHTPNEILLTYPEWNLFLPPDHRNVSSIYPPLALGYFVIARSLSLSPMIYGVLATLCNGVSIFFILKILKLLQKPKKLAIIFAWHPVVVFESAYGGHLDALGVMLLLIALYGVLKKKTIFAGWFAFLASLVKLWPIVISVVILGKQKKIFLALLLTLFLGLLALFYSWEANSGLIAYTSRWEFNGPVYASLKMLFSAKTSRILCFLCFMGGAIYFFYQATSNNLLKMIFNVILLYLIFSPTLYPWYLLWIIPLLNWQGHDSILGVTLMMPLSYEVVSRYHARGEWRESPYVAILIYGAPLVLGSIAKIISLMRAKTGKDAEMATMPIKGLDIQKSRIKSV